MSQEWYKHVSKLKVPLLSLLALLLVCMPILANTAYAASPDLTVTSVWLETAANPGQAVASVAPGDQFNIVASVKNIGDASAFGYYLDVYYDNEYGRGGPDNIAPGEVQTWYVGSFSAQAGTHTTKWVVDPDNQIAEASETNNQLAFSFTVGSVTVTTTTSQSSTTSTESTTSTTSTESTTSSTPSTYSVVFYADPSLGQISADGSVVADGTTISGYSQAQRVHIVASGLSGYQFASWEASGVSVDSLSSLDTYMTVAGSGSLKASFALPQVTVKSKSVLGMEFSGAKITVDSKSYSTPFSLALSGSHKFTAPSKVRVAGVSYTFVRWEDESGTVLSTSAVLSYSVQSSKTFYAVYNPPQYSFTAYAYDAKDRRALVGASVYLDGNLFGTTNSAGYLVLKGVYAGAHTVTIHKDGYVNYTTTISLSGSTTLRVYLNRAS